MTGTNMTQSEYARLAEIPGTAITDAEAVILINKDFGFEASRIEILHEAEIDATKAGERYITLEKVARCPVYDATDWNYVRFNVKAIGGFWHYEMVNGQLRQVYI